MTVVQPDPKKSSAARKVLTGGGWPMMLVRGVIALVIGIYLLIAPDDATTRFAQLLGVYAIFDGVANSWGALRGQGARARIWLLLRGGISIVAGLLLVLLPFQFPDLDGTIWLYLFAVQAIIVALIGFYVAIVGRRHIGNVPGMLLYNLAYLALGIFLLIGPSQFGDQLLSYSGFGLLALGVVLLIVALVMRIRR